MKAKVTNNNQVINQSLLVAAKVRIKMNSDSTGCSWKSMILDGRLQEALANINSEPKHIGSSMIYDDNKGFL